MVKIAISLDEKDIQEVNEIIIDKDKDGALKFLKDKIYSQVLKGEKKKLDVIGKAHL